MNAVMIAGTNSGSGKTTVTTALMAILARSGLRQACFKVGPDYIDPKFHKFITGTPSYNLDSYLLDKPVLHHLYTKHCRETDIAVIEGVMGVFDGLGTGETASSAEVAKLLGIPVILVVNVRGMSRSIAALINGYVNFDPALNVRGVILNNVSSPAYYTLLKQIIEQDTKVACLGYLSTLKDVELKSRHLGLIPIEELSGLKTKLDKLHDEAKKTLDIEQILAVSRLTATPGTEGKSPSIQAFSHSHRKIRVGIALDKAFNFYYEDNLELLRACNIELVPFSPLTDTRLPEGITALYIGGGFPEVYASELSENKALLAEISRALNTGLPAYAECGGLMYLTGGIRDIEDRFFPLTGFFDCTTEMTKRLQRFGYVTITYEDIEVRGHEFHHSKLEGGNTGDFTYAYRVTKASRPVTWECGLMKKNVLAAYAHVHFYSNNAFFNKILTLFTRGMS